MRKTWRSIFPCGQIQRRTVESSSSEWKTIALFRDRAGVLSNAGGVVFSGSTEGNIFALDATRGKPLWDFQAGGGVGSNPISFTVDGHQMVAVSADRVLYVFGL